MVNVGSGTLMKVGGFSVVFNLPEMKGVDSADDKVYGLPPYNQQKAYRVSDYPEAPRTWPRDEEGVGSYFVGVKPNHGMWLDFNGNQQHTHHVAVLLSIQGVNPLTGKSTFAQDGGDTMQQYRSTCPVHNTAFGRDNVCSDCGYSWPPQNYLAGNATPSPYFWLDGFRQEDGQVRQYFFTLEQARGIAAQVLGEDRTFNIGVRFFESREPKPPAPPPVYRRPTSWHSEPIYGNASGTQRLVLGAQRKLRGAIKGYPYSALESSRGAQLETTSLEVGAGARIHQKVYRDPQGLDFWKSEPSGTLFVNYVPADDLTALLRSNAASTEKSYLDTLKVGAQ